MGAPVLLAGSGRPRAVASGSPRGYRTSPTADETPVPGSARDRLGTASEQPASLGDRAELEAGVDAELLHQLGDPAAHGPDADAEVTSNRLVLVAGAQQ